MSNSGISDSRFELNGWAPNMFKYVRLSVPWFSTAELNFSNTTSRSSSLEEVGLPLPPTSSNIHFVTTLPPFLSASQLLVMPVRSPTRGDIGPSALDEHWGTTHGWRRRLAIWCWVSFPLLHMRIVLIFLLFYVLLMLGSSIRWACWILVTRLSDRMCGGKV